MLKRHQTTSLLALTDLQILGCELHENAFGGRALPRPAGGAIAFPRAPFPCFVGQSRLNFFSQEAFLRPQRALIDFGCTVIGGEEGGEGRLT